MKRLTDWPRRLADYIEREAERPFDWGFRDCCLSASAAVAAMTLADPLQPFIGAYSSPNEAIKAMFKIWGCRNVSDVAAHAAIEAKASEIECQYAQRGDVVLVKSDDADQEAWGAAARPGGPFAHKLGIVSLDARHILIKAPVGFARMKLQNQLVERVWRYG